MTTIIAILLFIIFLFLSGIHIYWALGGRWGNDAVIPTKDNNVKVMNPSVLSTIIVAFGLLGFGLVVLLNVVKVDFKLPSWFDIIYRYGLWVIAGIFFLRAIGDFNYVGFFQEIQTDKLWTERQKILRAFMFNNWDIDDNFRTEQIKISLSVGKNLLTVIK